MKMEVQSKKSASKFRGGNSEKWMDTCRLTVGNLLSHDLKRADLTTRDLHELSNSLKDQEIKKNEEVFVSKQTVDDIIREQEKIKKVLHANIDRPSHYENEGFINRERTKLSYGQKRGKIHKSKPPRNGFEAEAKSIDDSVENLETTMTINFSGSQRSMVDSPLERQSPRECEAVEITKHRVSRIDKSDINYDAPSRHYNKNIKPTVPAYIAKRRALLIKMNNQRFKHIPVDSKSDSPLSDDTNKKPKLLDRRQMTMHRSESKLLQKCLETNDNSNSPFRDECDSFTAKSFRTLNISLGLPMTSAKSEPEVNNNLLQSDDASRRLSEDYSVSSHRQPSEFCITSRFSPGEQAQPRLRLTRMPTRIIQQNCISPILVIKPATMEGKNEKCGDTLPQKQKDKDNFTQSISKLNGISKKCYSTEQFPQDPFPDENDDNSSTCSLLIYEERLSPLPRSSKFPIIKEQGSSSNNLVAQQNMCDFVPKPYTVLDDNAYARFERTKTTVRRDSKSLERNQTEDNLNRSYSSLSTYRAGTTL